MDINIENVDISNTNLSVQLSSNLENLLDDQDKRINEHIATTELQITLIVGDLSDVVKMTTALEDEVKRIKMGMEEVALLSEVLPGPHKYSANLCRNVGLPGLRYIARGEPKLQRFFWILFQLLALFISATYIQNAYYRWKSSPVVQSVKNTLTNVNEIPFPAITLCEHITLKEEYNQWEVLTSCLNVENKTSWLCNEHELDLFLLSHLVSPIIFCDLSDSDRGLFEKPLNDLGHLSNRTISGVEYHKFIGDISDDYTKWTCSTPTNISLCDASIGPIILIPQEIIVLGKSTWYVHKCRTYNGAKLVNKQIYDSSVKGSNTNTPNCDWALENMLKLSCRQGSNIVYTSDYVQFSTARLDKTFFVLIHNPAEHPNLFNMKPIGIQRHKLLKVKLSPKLVTAANDLSDLAISNRGCVFSHEKSLSMFGLYTYQNCFLECQIKCALKACGCVPYSISVLNTSIRVCTKTCLFELCECDCPPDCVFLSYDVNLDVEAYHSSSVIVEYKNLEFPSAFRYSVTSLADFIAYSLGILGVFNGICFMLLWELLSCLVLRLVRTTVKLFTP